MPFIDKPVPRGASRALTQSVLWLAVSATLAACGSPSGPTEPAERAAVASPAPVPNTQAGAADAPSKVAVAPAVPQPPARNWDEYRQRAARRIVEGSTGETFTGPTGHHLRSIPVLQVELNRDGSVRAITVRRTPKYSPETLQMAMRAVRRAAPFEPVGHLPRPWQFTETFLYNEDLKFQLLSLSSVQ